jgi:hypothetical protein
MPVITSSNAREMAAKSAEARKQRKLAADYTAALPAPDPQRADSYPEMRLTLVRRHLAKIDSLMEKETDPQKIDKLANASTKYQEQERILSGRSLPPTIRSKNLPGPKQSRISELPQPE